MAEQQHKRFKADARGNGTTALSEKESHVAESVPGAHEYDDDRSMPARVEQRTSFFDIYKPGQGYHTRVGTGIAYAVMVCWGAHFLYTKFELLNSKTAQVAVAVIVILGFGLLGYWLLARNRKVCDFLIATEGEMKKVNWTSRREIIGSTKVVILLTLGMSVMLFFVDLFFMGLFTTIGVLKAPGILEVLRNMF